ncbi:hypothetical protein FGIG_06412 [Fasciola gigantica]|uniref:Ankyrin repeat domain-containing protein n=1 Tax=Fasciola gigantica TaxID=46835 RepID=A0A504YCS4_FASGI|nr:hypothetical protein FGIG_06412 [Fasciola gigantica]
MLSTQPLPNVHNQLDQTPICVHSLIDREYPLHYCVFFGLRSELEQQLVNISPEELNKQDHYGNTALHIAVMLGHRECVDILLSAHCNVSIRNREGWNSLSEAISYGSNSLTTKLYRILRVQICDPQKLSLFDQTLRSIPNCRLEFEWEIVSWMPFLSKVLPSDVCCLRKIGNCLRLDTSLIDISGLNSTRGDLSVVFNPESDPPMIILNHEKKTFQSVGTKAQVTNDVAVLRSTELMHLRLCLDKMVYSRNERRNSKWTRGVGKTMVGKYHTITYTINNLCFKTIKRCEHLREFQKRRIGRHHLRRGKHSLSDKPEKQSTHMRRSDSLSPPRDHKRHLALDECNRAPVTWEMYSSGRLRPSETYLGRKPDLKRSERRMKLTVSMTDEIPISVPQLLDMQVIAHHVNKFNKLRKALQTGLPAGFPVRMEMPLVPTTVGRVTFTDVAILDDGSESNSVRFDGLSTRTTSTGSSQTTDIFSVPSNYRYAGEFHLSKPQTNKKHKKNEP